MGLLDGYWTKEEQQRLPGLLRGLLGFTEGTAQNVQGAAQTYLDPVGTGQGLLGMAKQVAADPVGAVKSGLLAARQRVGEAMQSPESAGMLASAFVSPGTVRGLLTPHVRDMTAYHGSPHDFDKFDSSKIGTGEGAQVYGHGLYFAEDPAVAASYYRQLSDNPAVNELRLGSQRIGQHNNFDYNPRTNAPYDTIRASLAENLLIDENMLHAVGKGGIQKHVLSQLDDMIERYKTEWPEGVKDAQRLRAELARPGAVDVKFDRKTGGVYHVDIPDEHVARMLDWDKPLSEQPESVRKAADAFYKPKLKTRPIGGGLVDVYEEGGGTIGAFPESKVAAVLDSPSSYLPFTGKGFYESVATQMMPKGSSAYRGLADKAASDYLNSLGVPGIRYLDGGSRGAGQGTRNFVLFNDKLVKVLNKE